METKINYPETNDRCAYHFDTFIQYNTTMIYSNNSTINETQHYKKFGFIPYSHYLLL
jgi:hypothetical protein